MKLKLSKPLLFFDIEATGLDIVNDRIVELSMLKITPNGSEEKRTYRINPTIPISKEASQIHGYKDEDVKDFPTFSEVANEVAQFIKSSDFAGYNSNKFDIPILAEELLRAEIDFDFKKCKTIDVQTIFHKMEQRTLSAAYKFYCNKELENAHTAEADTLATYEVLKAQIDRYDELKNDIKFLSDFSSHNNNVDFAGRFIYNKKGVEIMNFGKHKGKPVEEILKQEPGFYNWMLKGDFPRYTKKVLTAIKLRMAFANSFVK